MKEQNHITNLIKKSHNKKNMPLVSIVTPSYNQGEFIEDNILSVKNQDYPNIEHIIIDGGSTDNTLEILKKYENTYNMRWVSESDDGQADAVNKGFKRSKGEIIGWINSDDGYFDISAISSVVGSFYKYADADVIYGNAVRIDENNLLLFILKNKKFDYNYLKKTPCITQPAAFFRRKIIDKFQLNTKLEIAIDYEYWIRIGKNHKFQYVNRIFAIDRDHNKRKIVARIDEMVAESIFVSPEYGQFDNNKRKNKLLRVISYGIRLNHRVLAILILYSAKNFSFDIKLDGILRTILRQINSRIQNY